eukprot:6187327-Pleurochrysis_carterae.AAC.1
MPTTRSQQSKQEHFKRFAKYFEQQEKDPRNLVNNNIQRFISWNKSNRSARKSASPGPSARALGKKPMEMPGTSNNHARMGRSKRMRSHDSSARSTGSIRL